MLGNLFCTVPFVLEVSGFGVSFVDLVKDGVERHGSFHEWHGDLGSKEADEYLVVCDAGTGNVTLED